MKMKKQSIISTLIFAVILVSAVFSYSNIAFADQVELLYPNDGYVQAENVDCIGLNNLYTVTFDNENQLLSYNGTKVGSSQLEDSVSKIFVFGNTAVVKGEKGFYFVDFSADEISVQSTTLFDGDSYLATDGTSLFVHSYGQVVVYDESIQEVNTYTDSIFNNKPVLVAQDNVIYGFVVEHGISIVYTYDILTGEAHSFIKDTVIKGAVAGGTIFGYNGENIILVDKTNIPVDDGTLDFVATDITEQNFTAFGDYLYIAKGKDGFDKLAYQNGALTFVGNYSYTGSGLDKLNNPSSVSTMKDELIIADTSNNRILYVGDEVVALEMDAPTLITASKNRLYVLTSNGIAIVDNKTVVSTIKTSVEIRDMIYTDGLYVLAENGVYLLIGGSLIKVIDVNNCFAFASNSLIYTLNSTGVKVFNFDGNENELLSFAVDGYTPLDLLVDVVGNVYILGDDNAVHVYKWQDIISANISGNTNLSTEISIDSTMHNFSAKSMFEIDEKLVFATTENALISLDNPLVKNVENGVSIDTANYGADTYVTTESAYFITNENDGTTAVKIDSEMTLVCYEVEDMLYTSINGKKGWIFGADKVIEDTACAGEYIAKADIKLYANPMVDSGITVKKGTALNVIDNAGGYDGNKWVRVEYNGKTYYTEISGLQKKSSTTILPEIPKPEKPEKVDTEYGRAKASRAGELVSLYSLDGSTVVTSVADGTKLEVVEKIGEYYKVKHNGDEVLIHQDHFKLDGLTTVQIVAIILSVIVVLTGGLIFAVTSLSKKKEENQ